MTTLNELAGKVACKFLKVGDTVKFINNENHLRNRAWNNTFHIPIGRIGKITSFAWDKENHQAFIQIDNFPYYLANRFKKIEK